jgi:alpha-glucosidase (family GH31 glycosyl hydrolase)
VSVRGGQCRYDHLVGDADPGLHTPHLSLPITQENYTRTIWSRDAYGLPSFTNLYGAHPVYINQITGSNSTSASSHGVFLLNSNGMDVKFPESGKYLEYNVLGGIFDLYFFAGPTPAEASRQYVETIGESCARGACGKATRGQEELMMGLGCALCQSQKVTLPRFLTGV